MTVKKQSPIPFEAALLELEALVGQLEQGELSLEEALQRFERGVGLVRTCQNALQAAERTVSRLTERDGVVEIVPFDETAG
ncbi:MAG: exodeoxyribonuclease VII small subunit [Candidatus Competibacteraceae bacterium]|nr:exodeoxyribonuclease VII small subunit [Candidatus Competibacteraceae bacterium]MBK8899280.1 exodeoxyribonuclease VII small subunit [Candidatus Competibacteraceae bacterium]MBK8963318.1 exodeoxyribonuclease VII small subunit [Candidatus Competibacteraceae bacterium]MBK9952279.1 exodeoxyribonuclease VII small subunit [Candidatus Competibacteraceae bacterium]